MKKFDNYYNFVATTENTSVKLMTADTTAELANLLGLEAVNFTGDETETFTAGGQTFNKTSINAIKYEEDFLFFFGTWYISSSIIYGIFLIDSNFNYIEHMPVYSDSAIHTLWYCKTQNCILFRTNNMDDTSTVAACITKARNANGEYIPVGVYKTNTTSTSSSSTKNTGCHIRGKGISEYTNNPYYVLNTYNTLIALTNPVFASVQLVCDYIYTPTNMGIDFSPKRILLNGESWVYTGSYSSGNPGCGLFVKLDE